MKSRGFGRNVATFVLLSCGVPAAAAQSSSAIDLSGNWRTRFGPITLTQQGNSVTGKFQWPEPGEFTGRLEGVWLTGRWKTSDDSRSGTWRLELMPGANRLAGRSTPDDGGEILNFDAVRAELLARRRSDDVKSDESGSAEEGVSGRWTSSLGELSLRQEGELLTGIYDWDGGGRITGRRDGGELSGEWYNRDGTGLGRWNARLNEPDQVLLGMWIGSVEGVEHWTARRSESFDAETAEPFPAVAGSNVQDFTGKWRSRFGAFQLTEALQIVSGRFDWDGGGTITGTVANDTASGKWLATDGSRSGTWTLRLLTGGRILQGKIATTLPETSSESWTAIRVE